MTRVINLVAPSGVGKTTLARLLEEENDRYNVIQSYTTREPREKDEYGHTFLSKEKWYPVMVNNTFVGIENDGDPDLTDKGISHLFDKKDYIYIDVDDMIAYFNSYNSGHHYFATDKQVIRGKDNLYIVDPKGAEMVHEYYKENEEVEVITIYLYADKETRSVRMIERYLEYNNMNIDNPNNHMKALSTTAKRIEKDEDIFKNVKCDYFINANGSIEEVKEELKNILER